MCAPARRSRRTRSKPSRLAVTASALCSMLMMPPSSSSSIVSAFLAERPIRTNPFSPQIAKSSTTTTILSPTRLHYNSDRRSDGSSSSFFNQKELDERLIDLRKKIMNEEYHRPPNPSLAPQEFVSELLHALWQNSDPLPDSGFRLFLRCSTPRWKTALYNSVGAPSSANEEVVASALGDAMGRPHNQFAILCGEDELYCMNEYKAVFPTDPLDYSDGTCWLECHLRDKKDDSLFAITGWQLQQRASDGAWLVDRIDWQDFRDEYRPGIGREEWMRICG